MASGETTPSPRDERGHFLPGTVPNPKGRPPGILARDMARRYTELAIMTLVEALKYRQTMVPAAVALLDRGWGKPKETVEGQHLHLLMGGTDSPPIPETIEQWLERRRTQLDRQLTIPGKAEDGQ